MRGREGAKLGVPLIIAVAIAVLESLGLCRVTPGLASGIGFGTAVRATEAAVPAGLHSASTA